MKAIIKKNNNNANNKMHLLEITFVSWKGSPKPSSTREEVIRVSPPLPRVTVMDCLTNTGPR